jgi:uncharacterized protein (TIGR02996 family)
VINRDVFLRALAENEDDIATRMIFSDWLDEQGEHEEAARQRNWPAAKAWLVQFAKDYGTDTVAEVSLSYEDLISLGLLAREDGIGSVGDNQTLCDALRSRRVLFWKNWSIVTGITGPDDEEYTPSWSCSC